MSQPSLYPECTHIMPSGRNCQSPARRGTLFCAHHGCRQALTEANRARKHSVALPPLEDRAAIRRKTAAVKQPDNRRAVQRKHRRQRRIGRQGTGSVARTLEIANLLHRHRLCPFRSL